MSNDARRQALREAADRVADRIERDRWRADTEALAAEARQARRQMDRDAMVERRQEQKAQFAAHDAKTQRDAYYRAKIAQTIKGHSTNADAQARAVLAEMRANQTVLRGSSTERAWNPAGRPSDSHIAGMARALGYRGQQAGDLMTALHHARFDESFEFDGRRFTVKRGDQIEVREVRSAGYTRGAARRSEIR